jgi:hypothetical protein
MRRILPPTLKVAIAAGLVLLFAVRPGDAPVRAGTAVRMEVPDLAARADLVLEGRVLSAQALEEPSGRIDTEYVLRVDRTLWGEPLAVRSVRIPGGVLPDGRGLVVAGVPHMTPGEDVLLFLSPEGPSGARMPTGLAQGRFRVASDARGRKSLVRTQGDLTLVDPRTGAARPADGRLAFDYAAVLAEVEAALSVRRAALRAAGTAGGGGR